MSWRDTLFVWRGTLVGDGDRLTFEGSWVGATTGPGLPSLSEHEASENVFSVTGRIPGGGIDDLDGKTWTVDGGAYQLDNGEGLEEHADDAYTVEFKEAESGAADEPRRVLAWSVGENEFGKFIIAGSMPEAGVLCLQRRYIDNKDARATYDMAALYEALSSQAVPEGFEAGWLYRGEAWAGEVMSEGLQRAPKRRRRVGPPAAV